MIKILVIEDNPANMKLATTILSLAGFEVLQANEAETGLILIREQHPQIVLMDMQLPGMDGYAATRLIKADAKLAQIKVIAVTAHAMKGDEILIHDAGCDDYLSKPYHYQELLKKVNLQLKLTGNELDKS